MAFNRIYQLLFKGGTAFGCAKCAIGGMDMMAMGTPAAMAVWTSTNVRVTLTSIAGGTFHVVSHPRVRRPEQIARRPPAPT
ncbi:MAG: hypothetical protein ACPIDY_00875, partial [Candidatus Puniceispirillaceae bacterium]